MYILTEFGKLGFGSPSVLLYWLVCQTELYCEQASGREKFYCNSTGFYFYCIASKINFSSNTLNQCVRKPVRKFVLYSGTNSIAKSVSCRI
jgi:hypothetical protein